MRRSNFAETNKPALPGVLGEFRTALEEEIKAASRNISASATTLNNGRKIAHIGSSFQYVFSADSVLSLPGDTPAKLLAEGRGPLNATVISCEGLKLTIGLPVDLGAFVPFAQLQTDLTFLLQKLIERIEDNAANENSGGRRLIGEATVAGMPITLPPSGDLHTEQEVAVGSALGRDTTFISGPPGTGKTWTIGAIVAELFRRGQSVLVVSHTNTAIDEALLKADKRLRGAFKHGQLIRIGEPRKPELMERPDLLLHEIAKEREAELAEERDRLLATRESRIDRIKKLQRDLALCEWTRDAENDFAEMAEDVSSLQQLRAELSAGQSTARGLLQQQPEWSARSRDAQKARALSVEAANIHSEMDTTSEELRRLSERSSELRDSLPGLEALVTTAERLEPLRDRSQELPTEEHLRHELRTVQLAEETALRKKEQALERLRNAQALLLKTSSLNPLTRAWRGLPDPETVSERIKELGIAEKNADLELRAAREGVTRHEAKLDEIAQLELQLRQGGSVPRLPEAREREAQARKELAEASEQHEERRRYLNEQRLRMLQLEDALRTFELQSGATPDATLKAVDAYEQQLKDANAHLEALRTRLTKAESVVKEVLRVRVVALQSFGLVGTVEGSPEEIFEKLQVAFEAARSATSLVDEDGLRSEERHCQQEIVSTQAQIDATDEKLQHVEETLVAEAQVIATTLTRAYLREAIQARRFETVILDEASMAPIPALWVAAGLATRSVIVVGDPKQLPPIVQSSHDLAKKWLGRDIFEASGVSKLAQSPDHLVHLWTQNRMHPDIASVPNSLIYAGKLVNGDEVTRPTEREKKSLDAWYRHGWGHDSAVLLVDTGCAGAWVTSVPRSGRGSSRLNFLSATICVDIAGLLLDQSRPEWCKGGEPRILIVCPYRPHAKLLQLLLREHGLDGEVAAGTAHSFQGSEADVVILDLVNDEPHWRVAMFNPANDENSKRLLNVALTRARHRLIVVGDFDYAQRMGKRAFLGGRLIPFLVGRFLRCDALELVPTGLSARAAQAHMTTDVVGVVPAADWVLVTQEEFWPLFVEDLSRARERIVIYSAFLGAKRVEFLNTHIRAALDRGVRVWLVTKALAERGKHDLHEYTTLEESLRSWGAKVLHKQGMHEKAVFVDDDILWSGSLNPLSHSRTQEIMERRKSRELVSEFESVLRLKDLINEYESGEGVCPNCGNEVVAAEGHDEPFYWRCVDDGCYTRSVGQPRPVEGLIPCQKCSGAVEYGEWGGKPAWRCKQNKHHHQRIVRSHLKLPRMRELVPPKQLRKLDEMFGVKNAGRQMRLF